MDWLGPRNAVKVTPQDRFICTGLGEVGSEGFGENEGGHFGTGTRKRNRDRETGRQRQTERSGDRTREEAMMAGQVLNSVTSDGVAIGAEVGWRNTWFLTTGKYKPKQI